TPDYSLSACSSPRVSPVRTCDSKRPVFNLPISGETRRLGRGLLDQQMWCFGYDIRRSDGNLLREYGFTRQQQPEEERGSCYTLCLGSDCQVGLWGSGLFYGHGELGGLSLKRYQFHPKLTESPQLSANTAGASKLPAGRKPQTEAEIAQIGVLLGQALSWLALYEQWVQGVAGSDYRSQSVQAWHRKMVVSADEMAATWQELAGQFIANHSTNLVVT
ncbi:MAG: hypothetical protein AAF485_00740, partial [Chloroflexota bacterium]